MFASPSSSRVRIKTDTNAYSFNALFVSMRSKQEKVSVWSLSYYKFYLTLSPNGGKYCRTSVTQYRSGSHTFNLK